MNEISTVLTKYAKKGCEHLAEKYALIWERAEVSEKDIHGLSKLGLMQKTADIFAELIDADEDILPAIAIFPLANERLIETDAIRSDWGEDTATLIDRLTECRRFSNLGTSVDQDNYRGLLLSLAGDIRVIIVMIVENLALMREINHHPDDVWVRSVAFEAGCLYSQLAHRLGLYKIKGELEDLALKYTNREVYTSIARRLNETKRDRDAYITSFIEPVKKKLTDAGLHFEIKGRTKSISSIWAKIQKQKVDISNIYDLFAIRVIIDTPRDCEKRDCWLAYSILADMYRANPARMKDWISIPKSNGYESLHATVMGPGERWVEVQFRTRRMDLVAEKGLAAHWRYKGGHADNTDMWMNNIRDILETADEGPMQLMKNMRMDLYSKEVFAFTPKGDLLRLPGEATVLDFAFAIHTNVGCHCVGAIVNSRNKKINYKIHNGDTIEIVTSPTQSPRQDWLNIVTTGKARTKIRQALGESRLKKAELGKELFNRRAANRKIKIDESLLTKLLKKHGYKFTNDFFFDLADERLDAAKMLTEYIALEAQLSDESKAPSANRTTAESFKLDIDDGNDNHESGVTGLSGMKYQFAKCCTPIHGDEIFGFVSSEGVVKIHRSDCPNAANIIARYPYRIMQLGWRNAAEGATLLPATIKIVGTDDIGIVTNISSIINKDPETTLRNISIDSHDGIFQGYLTVGISGNRSLQGLMRKLLSVKGVKNVTRSI